MNVHTFVALLLMVQTPTSNQSTRRPESDDVRRQRPAALVAFEQSRLGLKTAEVSWTVVHNSGQWKGHKRHLRAIIAGPDSAFFDDGPVTGFYANSDKLILKPTAYLIAGDSEWALEQGGIMADRWVRAAARDWASKHVPMHEPRIFGMIPRYRTSYPIERMLWTVGGENGARTYRERKQGNLYEVVMTMQEHEVTWTIDPEKDWNAIRTTYSYNGKVSEEAIVTLHKFGDTWFPRGVAHFIDGGDTPIVVIEVQSAEFNAPHHRKRLAPKDIGMQAGMSYQCLNAKDPLGPQPMWAGEKAVTRDEYQRLGIKDGPAVLAYRARMRVTHAKLHWDALARNLIENHELTREQSAAAWAIVDDCKARIKNNSSPSEELLNGICEDELKPRLAALLTAEQRANGVNFGVPKSELHPPEQP